MIERGKKRLFLHEESTSSRLGTILYRRFKKERFRSNYKADQATKGIENEIAGIGRTKHVSLDTSVSNTFGNETKQLLFKLLEHNRQTNRTTRVDAIVAIRQYIENENTLAESDPP